MIPQNAHQALIEYGCWLLEPGIEVFPSQTVEAALGVGRKASGPVAQLHRRGRRITARGKETRTARGSDGGLGAMIDRMHYVIGRDNLCRDIREWLARPDTPEDYLTLVRCTYVASSSREIPRSPRSAARLMGCDMDSYYGRRARLHGLLDALLFFRRAA